MQYSVFVVKLNDADSSKYGYYYNPTKFFKQDDTSLYAVQICLTLKSCVISLLS